MPRIDAAEHVTGSYWPSRAWPPGQALTSHVPRQQSSSGDGGCWWPQQLAVSGPWIAGNTQTLGMVSDTSNQQCISAACALLVPRPILAPTLRLRRLLDTLCPGSIKSRHHEEGVDVLGCRKDPAVHTHLSTASSLAAAPSNGVAVVALRLVLHDKPEVCISPSNLLWLLLCCELSLTITF